MASDGSVVVEAILDASKVKKGVKDVNSALGGVSWEGIKDGDTVMIWTKYAKTLRKACVMETLVPAAISPPMMASRNQFLRILDTLPLKP